MTGSELRQLLEGVGLLPESGESAVPISTEHTTTMPRPGSVNVEIVCRPVDRVQTFNPSGVDRMLAPALPHNVTLVVEYVIPAGPARGIRGSFGSSIHETQRFVISGRSGAVLESLGGLFERGAVPPPAPERQPAAPQDATFYNFERVAAVVHLHEAGGGLWMTEATTPVNGVRVVEMRRREGAGVEWRFRGESEWHLPNVLQTRRWRPIDGNFEPVALPKPRIRGNRVDVVLVDDVLDATPDALPRLSVDDLASHLHSLGFPGTVLGVSERAELSGAFVVVWATDGSIPSVDSVPGNATLRVVHTLDHAKRPGGSRESVAGTASTLLRIGAWKAPAPATKPTPKPRYFQEAGVAGTAPTPAWLNAQVLRLGGRETTWELVDGVVRILVRRPFGSRCGAEAEAGAVAEIQRRAGVDSGLRVEVVVVEDPAPPVPRCLVRCLRDGEDPAVLRPDDSIPGDREEAARWAQIPDPELSRRRQVVREIVLRYAAGLDDEQAAALATRFADRHLGDLPKLLEGRVTRFAVLEADDSDLGARAARRAVRRMLPTRKDPPTPQQIEKLRAALCEGMKTRQKAIEEAGLADDEAALLVLERYADGLDDAEAAALCKAATAKRREQVNVIEFQAPARRGGPKPHTIDHVVVLADLEAAAESWLARRAAGVRLVANEKPDPEGARALAAWQERRRRAEAYAAELAARAKQRPSEPTPPPSRFELLEPDEAADPAAVTQAQREEAERRREAEAELRRRLAAAAPFVASAAPPAPRPHPFFVDLSDGFARTLAEQFADLGDALASAVEAAAPVGSPKLPC